MAKRIGNILNKIGDLENIYIADSNARKNKRQSLKYIEQHDLNQVKENQKLSKDILEGTYKTSKYTLEKIFEPKKRILYKLPYYPDRIAQHSMMNILKPIWKKQFIPNTYSCIEGRGIHKCAKDLKRDLWRTRWDGRTTYCLKLDITKFYPSINHAILKEIVQRKIKDIGVLRLIYEIIDSVRQVNPNSDKGIPIGNYMSQYLANLYLSQFDIWCKSELKCRFYYRYADDIVILSDNKEFLHKVLICIKFYLAQVLKLQVKSNYQIFPVEERGIDFVGYVFRHEYCLLRKSTKIRINKLLNKYKNKEIDLEYLYKHLSSYFGWLKYCNSKHFLTKIQKETNLKFSNFIGKKDKISNYYNKTVKVVCIVPHKKYFTIQFIYNKKPIEVKSKSISIFKFFIGRKLPEYIIFKKYERSTQNKKQK